MDEIEEAVARAICNESAGSDVYDFERGGEGSRWGALARAAISAHIAALEAAGFAIVPVEPTDEMAQVGFEVSADAIRSNRIGLDALLNPPVEAYKAMLAAAKEKAGDPAAPA